MITQPMQHQPPQHHTAPASSSSEHQQQQPAKRTKHALQIVDPITGKNVMIDGSASQMSTDQSSSSVMAASTSSAVISSESHRVSGWVHLLRFSPSTRSSWLTRLGLRYELFHQQLDGKYSERVQLTAKAKFGGFCRQHLSTLATPTIRSIKCKQSPVYGIFWPLLPHPSTDRNETMNLVFPSDGTIHRIVSNIAILKAYRIVSNIAIISSQTIQ